MTNLHTATHKSNFREACSQAENEFNRQVINLNDVADQLDEHIQRSRQNGWKNMAMPYPTAQACSHTIRESTDKAKTIYGQTEQAAIYANLNRKIAEEIYTSAHPIKSTFKKFVAGEVDENTLKADVQKYFGVRKSVQR